MTVRIEAFLALEASLAERLSKTAKKLTTKLYADVEALLKKGDFHGAADLVQTMSLNNVFEDNKRYVEYVFNLAMLFGASRVTRTPGTTVVGLGYEKMMVQQAMLTFRTSVVVRAENHLKNLALQLIAQAKMKANEGQQETIHKEPWTPEKRSAATAKAWLSRRRAKEPGPVFSSMKEMETWRDAIPVKFNPNLSAEATTHTGQFVEVGPKYRALPEEFQKEIMTHESAHFSGMDDWHLKNSDVWDLASLSIHGNVNGQTTPGEIIAEGYARAWHDPEWLLRTAPKLVPHILRAAQGVGAPIPQVLVPVTKADPEASVLQPFASFMDKNGKAFFDIASSLHTSRLSAYGFTAEADVMGYETYQITEQLDTRTCDVCRMMHGKTFKVKEARALLDVVLRTQDPEELQSLQPWPSQSKAGLAELADMDSRTMVEKGWHIPPFHPRCRGLLARSGKVEPLSTPTSVPKPPQEAYTPSAEEFKAFGHNLSQEKLDTWRDVVGIPPAEVIAGLVGTTPDELLAEVLPGLSMTKLKESLGLADLRFAEGSVALRLVRNIFGSKAPVSQTVKFLSKEEQLYLSVLDMDDVDQGSGIAKKYMRRLAALATETEMSSIGLTAGLDVGGYAWAKYGFIPSVDDWTTLKKEITGGALAQNFIKTLSGANLQVFKAIMESTDPKSIFALADVPELGKKLLLGSSWSGKLQLSDPEQMTRFMAYLGASK